MDSILKQLYLLFGISAVIFTLTGIAIGYSLGVWKSSRFYKKYIEITDEWFIHFKPKERDEYFEKSKKLKEWLEND